MATARTAIVLFGGTFDPPTRAHHAVAAAAIANCDANGSKSRLVLIPTARSPHKASGPVASDSARVRLLRKAFEDFEGVEIWETELKRPPPSYFIDTVREARARWPEVALRFVIGGDQLLSLHRWKDAPELLELARPIIVPRVPHDRDALREELQRLGVWREPNTFDSEILDLPPDGTNASAVRAALARGDDATAAVSLGPAVLRLAQELGLYRASK
ncbi:MAG: nicotinate-nicotinamide nucleotide adenylyltransferase [Planctomycetota bacterium]